MKKRGIATQIFYYIFAAILISFIFFFGYQQITRLMNLNEQASFVIFKSDLEKAVSNVYYKNPGSVVVYSSTSSNKPLILPKDVKEVCFTEINQKISVNSKSKYFTQFEIENLIAKEKNYCIKTINSKLPFTLENKIVNGKAVVEIR